MINLVSNFSKRYLLASDFDQTLSFNDSGEILAESLGINNYMQRVHNLSSLNLVQQGGELAYLLLHDPDFRQVRAENLLDVGRRVRLKPNIALLYEILTSGIQSIDFDFFVISAAPEEVIISALDGIVPKENIFGTRFSYHKTDGSIQGIERVAAGYGKVAVLNQIRAEKQIPQSQVVYVGDGSSDIHVMLDVNHRRGLTIAVSESQKIADIANRTVLCDDALCILIPILEEVLQMNSLQLMDFLATKGLALQDWTQGRTDRMTFQNSVYSGVTSTSMEERA